ncbi:MAG TPA: phosphoribosyltransferase [Nakamurella sp.]
MTSLLTYAVVAHWECVGSDLPDAWTVVPSLSGRVGHHPLGEIARGFFGSIPYVPLTAAQNVTDPRTFRPGNFVAHEVPARHVLVLEDTWVSGARAQSAAAKLKQEGARVVTALTVARWLRPEWASTESYIKTLPLFDPDICPYTGRSC